MAGSFLTMYCLPPNSWKWALGGGVPPPLVPGAAAGHGGRAWPRVWLAPRRHPSEPLQRSSAPKGVNTMTSLPVSRARTSERGDDWKMTVQTTRHPQRRQRRQQRHRPPPYRIFTNGPRSDGRHLTSYRTCTNEDCLAPIRMRMWNNGEIGASLLVAFKWLIRHTTASFPMPPCWHPFGSRGWQISQDRAIHRTRRGKSTSARWTFCGIGKASTQKTRPASRRGRICQYKLRVWVYSPNAGLCIHVLQQQKLGKWCPSCSLGIVFLLSFVSKSKFLADVMPGKVFAAKFCSRH